MRFIITFWLSALKKKNRELDEERSKFYVRYGKRPLAGIKTEVQKSITELEELLKQYP